MSKGYGPTIVDGEIQYLSASGISRGDVEQEGGCLRRWWYVYVDGKREPFTAANKLGVLTHEELERHMRTGEMCLGNIALTAKQFIPARNNSQHYEFKIDHTAPDALSIEGIPIVGEIDLLDLSHGAVEVLDWKTTSNVEKWSKRGADLIKTVQMPLYGMFALSKTNDDFVRLSHVYMQTRGKPCSSKETARHSREEVETRWTEIGATARLLKQVAKETDPAKVPANRGACDAWRGCPHAPYCPRTKTETVNDIFGITKAREIKGEKIMTLEEEMKALQSGADDAGVLPDDSPLVVPEGFAEDWAVILAADKGVPPLDAGASVAWHANRGQRSKALVPGHGKFGGFTTPLRVEDIKTLAQNLRDQGVVVAPTPAAVAPTPAQKPEVTLTLVPPVVIVDDKGEESTPDAIECAPDEVILTIPQEAIDGPPEEFTENDTTNYSEVLKKALDCLDKGSFSTMRKPEMAEAFEALLNAKTPQAVPKDGVLVPETVTYRDVYDEGYEKGKVDGEKNAECAAPGRPDDGIRLYINAVPSCPFDRLDAYVRSLCVVLEEHCSAADIRCSDHQKLAFGKWKGTLAALTREIPPEAGVYMVDTRGCELSEVVANTLRESASVWVRGIA